MTRRLYVKLSNIVVAGFDVGGGCRRATQANTI